MVPPQNQGAAGIAPAPVQNRSAAAAASNTALTSADWDKIVEQDRASVRAKLMPPEVIKYDLEIGKMLPEAQEILASQDKARARVWSKKMNGLMDARNKATQKFAAKEIARNNAIANSFGGGRPDPCLSPMGKNTCASSAPAQSGGGVNYTVGPGGIGATMGNLTIGPGGIGGGF
jgi:hypothetical protein